MSDPRAVAVQEALAVVDTLLRRVNDVAPQFETGEALRRLTTARTMLAVFAPRHGPDRS